MSRRLEITVPNDWSLPVRECLEDPNRCNLSKNSGSPPNMIVQLRGCDNTVFFITVTGPAVSRTLEVLRKNGIGVKIGRICLTSLEYIKPDLSQALENEEMETQHHIDSEADKRKIVDANLHGYKYFQKARKTTEELYNEISNGATMTLNTWLNLIGASLMAAGGLASDDPIFVVASVLVSPIIGPVLGMTFGYRVADWPLFKLGFLNELKIASVAFSSGAFYGLALGYYGVTNSWTDFNMSADNVVFSMAISLLVSIASGLVLAVSLTSSGGNALVGTAISAGLLPPLVHGGMVFAYGGVYASGKEQQTSLFSAGGYSLLFYLTHLVTIFFVANFVFWLKEINPKFREGDDADFNQMPTLVAHKRRLEELGHRHGEVAKAEMFIGHIKDDVTDFALDIKGRAQDFAHLMSGGLISAYGTVSPSRGDVDPSATDIESQAPAAVAVAPGSSDGQRQSSGKRTRSWSWVVSDQQYPSSRSNSSMSAPLVHKEDALSWFARLSEVFRPSPLSQPEGFTFSANRASCNDADIESSIAREGVVDERRRDNTSGSVRIEDCPEDDDQDESKVNAERRNTKQGSFLNWGLVPRSRQVSRRTDDKNGLRKEVYVFNNLSSTDTETTAEYSSRPAPLSSNDAESNGGRNA